MFLIRRRDDRGSEDRSGIIDNSCFETVERCRYVTGGMNYNLTPLPRTTDVSFADNTPTPFVTLHSSSLSNFQTNFARSRQSSYRWYDLLLCCARLLVVYNLAPWYHGCSNSTSLDRSMSMETSQRHLTIVSGKNVYMSCTMTRYYLNMCTCHVHMQSCGVVTILCESGTFYFFK